MDYFKSKEGNNLDLTILNSFTQDMSDTITSSKLNYYECLSKKLIIP